MQDSQARATLEVIRRFNEAFNRHDVDGVMALMTDTCVFENTFPAPDGERYEGQAAVRAFWERFFASTPQALRNRGGLCGRRPGRRPVGLPLRLHLVTCALIKLPITPEAKPALERLAALRVMRAPDRAAARRPRADGVTYHAGCLDARLRVVADDRDR